jgi:hypothetical protein
MSAELEMIMYDEEPQPLKEWILNGGDPSEIGNWALNYAEDNDFPLMIEILKKDKRVQNYEQFIDSIKKGNLKNVVKYYKKLTSIIDDQSPNRALLIARNEGYDDIEQFLLNDPRIQLQEIVHTEPNPDVIRKLLKKDIVFNEIGIEDVLGQRYYDLYEDEILRRKRQGVLDTAIAFRDLSVGEGPLPLHVVEEIINHAYDTRGTLGLHEIIPRIEGVFKFKRKK